jgi:hypothetical protein
VSPRPDRRPLWLSLHCAAARYARLRSVARQLNLQGKEQHQENSRSSLPFSFSPYCSLIKSTKLSQRCWHGVRRVPQTPFLASFRIADKPGVITHNSHSVLPLPLCSLKGSVTPPKFNASAMTTAASPTHREKPDLHKRTERPYVHRGHGSGCRLGP